MTKLHVSYLACKQKHGAVVVARDLLLVTLRQCGSIKQTAREWQCSKNTVKLARKKRKKHSLRDASKTPKKPRNKTPDEIEDIVCKTRKATGYGKRRLRGEIIDQYDIVIPESTIGKILKRKKIPNKVYKSAWRRNTRRYYDRSHLEPFDRNEVDVKEILDKKALPGWLYHQFQTTHLPLYQWTWIDVTTRIRFVAYSYEHTWMNGQTYFRLVTAWLRMFGVRKELVCSIDGGKEWHANLESCFEKAKQNFYKPLGLHMSVIRKGHPEDNPFVERSHRTDDEECYVPLGKQCQDEKSFLKSVQWWHLYYNTQRRHQGIADKTPIQVLKQKRPQIHPAVAHFPPIILDRHFTYNPTKGGQDVLDHYQNRCYKKAVSLFKKFIHPPTNILTQ